MLAVTLLLLIIYHFSAVKAVFVATIFFVLLALIFPALARVVDKAWSGLTKILGWFSNKVLMSIVFLLLLTPLAFLYRIFSKGDSKKEGESHFVDRHHTYSSKDIESPW